MARSSPSARSASRSVDRLQARHLVLSVEGPEQTVVTSPHHHLPHFLEQSHMFDEQRFWLSDATRDLTARTRVLDIQGYCPPMDEEDLLLFMRFPALEVLRLTHSVGEHTQHFHPWVPPSLFFPANTLVLFSDEVGMDALADHWCGGDADDGSIFPDRDFEGPLAIPGTVSKLVVNMCGEDPEAKVMWPFTACDLPPHVKEVVIVGPRYKTLHDAGSVGELTPGLSESDLIEIAVCPRAEKVTFVGFERMERFRDTFEGAFRNVIQGAMYAEVDYEIDDAATLALAPEERAELIKSSKELREKRRAAKQARGEWKEDTRLLGYQEKIDQMLANYEFVTKTAYIDRVGEETAELELLEYLDPKDLQFRKGHHWRHRL